MHLSQLLLVRHGATDWNQQRRIQGQTDVPLNETGRAQVRSLVPRLQAFEMDALYSSDLSRASESAAILGEALGLRPRLSHDLREFDIGRLDGRVGEFGDLIAAAARGNSPAGTSGETFRSLQDRVLKAYRRVEAAHPGRTVLIVAHGGVLRTLIAHLVGLEPKNIDRISLRTNSSLSIVDYRLGRPQLVLLNDGSHLDGGLA